MAKKFLYANVGSISSGTMHSEDLIPTFLDELEYYAKRNHRKEHLALVKCIREDMDKPNYFDSDLNEELFDALQEYALPYFHFGSHPGDGADYGFWLSEDFENEFDGLKVEDTSDVPTGYTGEVLHINDHSNMTLYKCVRGRLYEIWGIV